MSVAFKYKFTSVLHGMHDKAVSDIRSQEKELHPKVWDINWIAAIESNSTQL